MHIPVSCLVLEFNYREWLNETFQFESSHSVQRNETSLIIYTILKYMISLCDLRALAFV